MATDGLEILYSLFPFIHFLSLFFYHGRSYLYHSLPSLSSPSPVLSSSLREGGTEVDMVGKAERERCMLIRIFF